MCMYEYVHRNSCDDDTLHDYEDSYFSLITVKYQVWFSLISSLV